MSAMEGARVLVIDDDETIRAVVRRLVEFAGASVTEVETGEDGLRALYVERPDLVVLDIDLPGLDGWQVLERIRQLTDVPVVMLSGHADELEKGRALQAGARDYVHEPLRPAGAPRACAGPCPARAPHHGAECGRGRPGRVRAGPRALPRRRRR